MKKNVFSVVAIVALSSVATFVSQNFRPVELTPVQLANIEALANPEGGGVTLLGCNPK